MLGCILCVSNSCRAAGVVVRLAKSFCMQKQSQEEKQKEILVTKVHKNIELAGPVGDSEGMPECL